MFMKMLFEFYFKIYNICACSRVNLNFIITDREVAEQVSQRYKFKSKKMKMIIKILYKVNKEKQRGVDQKFMKMFKMESY